jgi:hypothetical protein
MLPLFSVPTSSDLHLGYAVSGFSRRLEDRIRELCARAISETEPDESDRIHDELRRAVHQYVERIRNRAAAALSAVPDSTLDRREKVEEPLLD